jgi:iron complex outermembrane receptor protein
MFRLRLTDAWLALSLAAAAVASEPQAPERRDVVVVTGTFEPVALEELDRSLTVIDTSGQQQLLANTLADFLKLDPSVDLRQRGPNLIQGDVSIRGGTFGQTLVLLDGLRLNDVQSGHHNLNLPAPLEIFDRVEILRGSGSAFHGSDAVGGAVNFISRTPEAPEVVLRGGAGNFGANQQRATVAFGRPAWSQLFSASRDFSSGFRENRDYRHTALASKTSFDTRWGKSSLLLAHADRPFGADRFYGNFNSWERTRTWFAGARQTLGERTELSFAFRRHTDLFVLYRDRPEAFTNRHASEAWQGAVRRHERLGASARLHYGLETIHESIASNNLGSHSRARGAGFVAADVRALGRFSFTVGAREEVYRGFRGQFSPTASAGVWLSSRLKVRGAVGRAFRLPSFTDLYYHDPANRGSPDLRPESAWSYEGGIDFRPAGALVAELTVFQRRERDGIDYVRRSPDDIWRATNIQRLRFTGVEAGLALRPGRRQRVELRYTALSGAQDALQDVVSRYVFNYPRHSGVASWGTEIGGVAFRSRLGAFERYQRDPYAVWDLYAARSRGRLRPFLQLTNLTATVYEEILGVPMPGRGILGGVEIRALPAPK